MQCGDSHGASRHIGVLAHSCSPHAASEGGEEGVSCTHSSPGCSQPPHPSTSQGCVPRALPAPPLPAGTACCPCCPPVGSTRFLQDAP